MKHILLSLFTIVFAFTATTASAAFNYDVEWKAYDNSNYEGTSGKYFTVKVTEGTGKIYIADLFNNIQSNYQGEALASSQMGVTGYGYYYVNNANDTALHDFSLSDSSRVSQLDYYEYNTWKAYQGMDPDKYYRNGYLLGEFKAGDEIEIYLTDGNMSVSSNTPTGKHISNYGVRQDALNPDMRVATLYLGPSNGVQVNFGILGMATESVVVSEDTGTFGSPLPGGVPIILVSGLFAFGFWFVRRRKVIAA